MNTPVMINVGAIKSDAAAKPAPSTAQKVATQALDAQQRHGTVQHVKQPSMS